ncbi:SusC/RagA family TonB-linked outer membrane protein [Cytophagaceae bacterium SJW1-29]|uniref:SusC/RagA family TonB-linked outer membrane protein n=2 Tax=Salmonirosea aquatica TaxID=2654236 RepID=A0A7C9BGE5_9BACT|nr:SusC/RagA family TonB-linked outer membrane protein [Cytophagaceae bacterium SJW1-29]
MKITLIQFCIAAIFAGVSLARDAVAQELLNQKISLKAVDQNLKSVLSDIEYKAEIRFTYRPRLIPTDQTITLSLSNESLGEVLDRILLPLKLKYRVIGKEIVLSQQSNSYATPQPFSTISVVIPDRLITGTITDEKGQGLPGVSIVLKGTQRGTTTNTDGRFQLTLPDRTDSPEILVFSFVGYKTQEINIGSQSNINLSLQPDDTTLDEIVVVGYGTERKVDLTGSVVSVKADQIASRQSIQLSDALQGAIPGVTVTRNNSAPGATSTIRVRGITTFNTNDPLVIIDGVPSGGINDINPNDVESISVLKDASAASIYGSRAAAGVILVTTKRGIEGKKTLSYTYEFGSSSPTALPEFTDAKRYMELFNEREANDGLGTRFNPQTVANYEQLHAENPDLYPNTNWQDVLLTQTPQRHRHNLTFSIGNKFLRTNASLNYDTEDALYVKRDFSRYTARVNNDFLFSDKLTAFLDLSFKNSVYNYPGADNTIAFSRRYPGIYDDRYEDGRWATGKDGENAAAILVDGGTRRENYNKLTGRIGLEFKPFTGFSIKGIFSPTLDFDKSKEFNKVVELSDRTDPNRILFKTRAQDKLSENRGERVLLNKQLLLTYDKTLGDHTISILAGYEDVSEKYENLAASRTGFAINSFPYLNLGSQDLVTNAGWSYAYGLNSYFGRLKYDYQNKYLVQGNIRADGSSRFAPENRWGYFPSVSVGWVVSNENFFKEVRLVNLLKIRASYGTLGNERVSGDNSDAFKWWPYQALINFRNSLFYQNGQPVSLLSDSQTDYAVTDITWETTKTSNVGVDLGLFNNRLSTTFEYYVKNTDDILMPLDIPDYLGFVDPVTNVGAIRVKGWDFQISYRDRIGKLNYSASFNLSDSKSTVIDINGRNNLTQANGTQISREGNEFSEWYGYESPGLFLTQEDLDNSPKFTTTKLGDVKYVDQLTVDTDGDGVPDKGDGIINEFDKIPLGGSLPRYIFGGNISLNYGNFDFTTVFQGVGKQTDRLNDFQVAPFSEDYGNVPAFIDGRSWSTNNTDEQNRAAIYPRLSRTSSGNNYAVSNFWFINAAYFRIKNIALGYNVPENVASKMKLGGLRIYVSLRDYFAIHNYPKGWDPEGNAASYPVLKSFTAGISIKL